MLPDVSLGGSIPIAVVAVVVLLVAILWVFQFAKLMSLDDSDFPGPFVRFGWVAGFVVLWFLAPIAFMLWRARSPAGSRRRRLARSDAD